MASTYTANLGIEKPGSGEQSGTWGTTTNTNFDIIDRAINGVLDLSLTGTTTTLTTSDGALSNGGYKVLVLSGSPTGTNTITISPNDQDKVYLVNVNGNSITSASDGNVVIAPNGTGDVQLDADTVRVGDANADVTVTTNGTGDLTLNTNAGTDSGSIVIADGADNNVTLTANGTGNVVLASNTRISGDVQLDGTTNNWTIEVDADDHLIFKYNGTAVLAVQDTGEVIAKDDITAFGTPT